MKKATFIISLFLLLNIVAEVKGQYTRADIFNTSELTWYGLDFSSIKLIGPDGFTDVTTIKEIYFAEINNLVRIEPEKYDLRKSFHKSKVTIDLNMVKERNKTPDVTKLVLDHFEEYAIDEDQVSKIVGSYKTEAKSGIGVVFIMEKFVKLEEAGYMWVVFFDISTKNILLMENMTGKAGGFGWRNYWARTFFSVLKEIEKTRYNLWLMD